MKRGIRWGTEESQEDNVCLENHQRERKKGAKKGRVRKEREGDGKKRKKEEKKEERKRGRKERRREGGKNGGGVMSGKQTPEIRNHPTGTLLGRGRAKDYRALGKTLGFN